MRHIPRFYTPQTLTEGQIFPLPPDVQHHLIEVLRKRKGDVFRFFNGTDKEYTAVLRSSSEAEIQETVIPGTELGFAIQLLQAVPKADTLDWIIEKATEMGVSEIVPLKTAYSPPAILKQDPEKMAKRWKKIAIQAAQQSGRTRVPLIQTVQSFHQGISSDVRFHHSFIFSLEAKQAMNELNPEKRPVRVLIGSEGGLSDEEEKMSREAGFQPRSLGSRILRAETAVIAALTLCQAG